MCITSQGTEWASGVWLEWQLQSVVQKAPFPTSQENRETQTLDSLASAISLGGPCTMPVTPENSRHQHPEWIVGAVGTEGGCDVRWLDEAQWLMAERGSQIASSRTGEATLPTLVASA